MKHKTDCHWWNTDSCEVSECPDTLHCHTPIKPNFEEAYNHLSNEYKKLNDSYADIEHSLNKAIKALEYVVDKSVYCSCDEDVSKAQRFARQTLKEIRGESCT